jgi:hypothetical protein
MDIFMLNLLFDRALGAIPSYLEPWINTPFKTFHSAQRI